MVTIAGGTALFRIRLYAAAGSCLAAGCALFLFLAGRHSVLFARRNRVRRMAAINKQGLDRCNGWWGAFPEQGDSFIDRDHPYTSDLDIFGTGSLYQYCCCARTFFGRKRLADLLTRREGDLTAVTDRQKAVDSLSGCLEWRQTLECLACEPGVSMDPGELLAWAESPAAGNRIGKFFVGILPSFSWIALITALTGYFVAGTMIPVLPFVGIQIALAALFAQKNFRTFAIFGKHSRALSAYGGVLGHLTGQRFEERLLWKIQQEIAGGKEGDAPVALHRLASIAASSEVRFSPLPWFLANALWLWDIRCAIRLERWKELYGSKIRQWFGCIGEFEALSSLAILRFEHQSWVFPEFSGNRLALSASGIGHPLLPAGTCVVNDFDLGSPGGSVTIVTGSNMSGKSTFLRTLGINLVLAYAGAPVCAKRLGCPLMQVYTSMRTTDDLQSHLSTFYAELLRIKKIVDAAEKGETLLFLLDELFHGTNSADRHDGAVALLSGLSRHHTLGVISTHDLELCTLGRKSGLFNNMHFEERFESGELRFDYRLKNGPSTTRNALFLMRMVGIGESGDTPPESSRGQV